MNYDLSKYKFLMLDIIYQGIQEIPLDSDITLPDYCPDIGKILKCQVTTGVISRNISGDLLSIEGISTLELLYSDLDKNTVRCFKTEIPFSQNFNIKNSCEFAVSTFKTKREYINCRAISPRRIDAHGAFSLKIQVFGSKNFEITNNIESEDIKQKKSDISFSQLSSLLQHQISINEILDLGSEKSAPEFIIKSNVSVSETKCNAENERVNIKGKANVKILYMTDIETGKLDFVEHSIPINETIDAPGVMDDNSFMIVPEIISHDEKISSDSDSIGNLISEEMKLMVTIFAFQDDETKVIDDAYSTKYETELCNESFNFKKFAGTIDDNITHKETLTNNENKFFKILDIWPGNYSCDLIYKDSNFKFEGKVNLCILSLDPEFTPFYFEREIKFSKDIYSDKDYSNFESNVFMSISQIESKILTDNSIEVKLNIEIIANIYENQVKNIISSITSNDSCAKQKESDTALAIYYAHSGESIWNIAKSYGTTIEKIQDENDIDSDILDSDRVILIPIA